MKPKTALIGKAGELLVAAELMRRGIEVAYPASDVGVDLLAYVLKPEQRAPRRFFPIQVKSSSGTGYYFKRDWFDAVPGLALVQVWNVATSPEFYIFRGVSDVESAIGAHARTDSWVRRGIWSATTPSALDVELMKPHRGRWERVINEISDSAGLNAPML